MRKVGTEFKRLIEEQSVRTGDPAEDKGNSLMITALTIDKGNIWQLAKAIVAAGGLPTGSKKFKRKLKARIDDVIDVVDELSEERHVMRSRLKGEGAYTIVTNYDHDPDEREDDEDEDDDEEVVDEEDDREKFNPGLN